MADQGQPTSDRLQHLLFHEISFVRDKALVEFKPFQAQTLKPYSFEAGKSSSEFFFIIGVNDALFKPSSLLLPKEICDNTFSVTLTYANRFQMVDNVVLEMDKTKQMNEF